LPIFKIRTDAMNQIELKQRTKQFALRVMKLVDALPSGRSGNAIGNQLMAASRISASRRR
jgi:hypothetical protein